MSLRNRVLMGFAALLVAVPAAAREDMPVMGPSPEIQKMAAETVGTWDVAMQFKMDPAQAEWMETEGVAEFKAILDGCAVVMNFQADMGGMPMRGMSTTVYDREAREWVETWIDNMTARMSIYRGGFQGDAFVTQGEDMVGGVTYLSRNTAFNRSADRYEWRGEMSADGGNTWFAWANAVYTRRK